MPRATMERRKGKLTGHMAADCTVTISKMDGVESSQMITDVSPHVPDGNYTFTVEGESSTSQWRRDRNAGRQTAVWVDPRDDQRQRLRVAAYGPVVAQLPRTPRERSLSSGSGRAALIRPVNCRYRTGP
jgi:hypothetical protein